MRQPHLATKTQYTPTVLIDRRTMSTTLRSSNSTTSSRALWYRCWQERESKRKYGKVLASSVPRTTTTGRRINIVVAEIHPRLRILYPPPSVLGSLNPLP